MKFSHVNQHRAYERGRELVRQQNDEARRCPCGRHKGSGQVICWNCWAGAPLSAKRCIYSTDATLRRVATAELLRFASERRSLPPTPVAPASRRGKGSSTVARASCSSGDTSSLNASPKASDERSPE